jgi:hypothetical protein
LWLYILCLFFATTLIFLPNPHLRDEVLWSLIDPALGKNDLLFTFFLFDIFKNKKEKLK